MCQKHLLIKWVVMHYMSKKGWQNSSEVWTFWYLALKYPKKNLSSKVMYSEKIVRFLSLGEKTLISWLFIVLLYMMKGNRAKGKRYLKNVFWKQFFHIPQFWRKIFVWLILSQISKYSDLRVILPPFLTRIIHYN